MRFILRLFSRPPGWFRKFMTWQARRAYGTWLFTWINGEVSHFVFMQPGNPLFRGAMTILLCYLAAIAGVYTLGLYYPGTVILWLMVFFLILPGFLSSVIVMRTLSKWRKSEILEELAILPYSRNAIRSMLLLPSGMALRSGNFLLAWLVFLAPAIWLGTALAGNPAFQSINLLAGGSSVSQSAGAVVTFLLLLTAPFAYFCYAFACGGIPAGWYLATRFHGPNAIALTIAMGMRLVLGLVVPIVVGGYLFYYFLEREVIGLGTTCFLVLFAIGFMQTWKLGITIPRRWAYEDTELLQKHGIDVMRSPEDFAAAAGNPSPWRVMGFIIWPWPRLDSEEFFAD